MRNIVAISTPPGRGGIGIVRISGPESLDFLKKIFVSKSGGGLTIKTRYMHYGLIKYKGKVIDEVLACYFKAPHSYTMEDMVEIYCHGGYVVCLYLLQILLELGCVQAEAGEFTKLAFLNGRIDLLEAEAVEGIIEAQTREEHLMYTNILGGALTDKIEKLNENLIKVIAECEAKIDYPELGDVDDIKEKIEEMLGQIDEFLEDEKRTTLIREGLKLAIIGRPNVGKSSLLNALTNKERAIVTEIPGTTRDTVEEFINFEGLYIRLIDTAGIRDTDERIEKIGIDLSIKAAKEADFVIVVLDGSEHLTDDDKSILEMVDGKPNLILINKEDKGVKLDLNELSGRGYLLASIKEDRGVRELMRKVKDMVVDDVDQEISSIFNIRQREAFEKARSELVQAYTDLEFMPFEIVEVSLREALMYINQILGRDTDEEIVDRVFRDFCVGK